MVICNDIISFMEELAPTETAEDWDNVGLLCGDARSSVKKLMLCLDASSSVIEEAVHENIDLLISHHPLIFKSMKRIVESDFKGSLLSKLIKNDISLYSAHTNLDVAVQGVNQRLAESLQLTDIITLKNIKTGLLESEPTIGAFIETIKIKLNVRNIRFIGALTGKVKKVAVFCGSFDGDLETVRNTAADVLVTGDIKYHTAMDAQEMGMCIIDAGHFNTEKIVLPHLVKLISSKFPDIHVLQASVEKDPFNTY